MIPIAQTWDGHFVDSKQVALMEVRRVDGELHIEVSAPYHDDPIPPGRGGPTDELWTYQVVELFLVGESGRYTEIEMGPLGHHLVLQLDGVRNPVATKLPMAYEARVTGPRWIAEARLSMEYIEEPLVSFNAFRIHGVGDERRYLAHHPMPGPHPDFHRLDLFPPWRGFPTER